MGERSTAVGLGAEVAPAPLLMPSGYRLALASLALAAGGAAGDRVADVAHRTVAADVRQDVEVVRVRRREGEPLEGVAAPRGVPGLGAVGAARGRRDEGPPERE